MKNNSTILIILIVIYLIIIYTLTSTYAIIINVGQMVFTVFSST